MTDAHSSDRTDDQFPAEPPAQESPRPEPTGAGSNAAGGSAAAAGPDSAAAPAGPDPAGSAGPGGFPSPHLHEEPVTGPIHRVEPGWQSRPSGALSAPSPWSQQGATGAGGPAYTSRYPGVGGAGGGFLHYGSDPVGAPSPEPVGAGTAVAVAERPRRTGRTAAIVGATIVLALGAGFGGGVLGSHVGSTSAAADTSLSTTTTASQVGVPLTSGTTSIQAVAAKVLPSVVSIVSQSSSAEGEGSGIILSADGLILTNNHVVDGATTLTVRFNDESSASADIVGTDATDDLAVIKVSGVSGLTKATLGSSASLQVGQPVVAVGSPLGLTSTVTSGIVSALNRPVQTGSSSSQQQSTTAETVYNAIQTDAAINPGNSGGALVDMNGQVIGINSAIATASSSSSSDSESGSIGVGFAIPIDQARRIAQEIVNSGHANRAVLGASVSNNIPSGVSVQSELTADALSQGAKLTQIVPGQAAEKAGLQTGDVVTKVGTEDTQTGTALVAAIRSQTPGGTVQITYQRSGQTKTVSVTLGSTTAS